MTPRFVDPFSKRPLALASDGSLKDPSREDAVTYERLEGCYDFSKVNNDIKQARDVYDRFYARTTQSKLTIKEMTDPWFDSTVPWRATMLTSLGTLGGKRVLLLGNGES